MFVEEAIDGGLKIDNGTEDAALQPALAQRGEEAFDGVEPRGEDRREVERPARMTREPFAHFGVLVGGVIVEDRMDSLAGGNSRSTALRKRMNS